MSQHERQWYVVYSKPQKEDYATIYLRSKGLQVFFPRLLLPESSKRRKLVVPLFPNYLFVRLLFSDEYHYVIWSPGVKGIISFNGSPASVDEKIVSFLMLQSDQQGIIAARSNLKTGQEVRVTGGPFNGLLGIIQEPPNARGRVKILLTILNRETQVDVPVHYLNGSWTTPGVTARPIGETQSTDLKS